MKFLTEFAEQIHDCDLSKPIAYVWLLTFKVSVVEHPDTIIVIAPDWLREELAPLFMVLVYTIKERKRREAELELKLEAAKQRAQRLKPQLELSASPKLPAK